MSTGNGSATGKQYTAMTTTKIRFERGRLVVVFSDKRELSVPLRRYPALLRATTAERNAWKLIGPGKAIHWPKLDLDLSVTGIVAGLPELISQPRSLRKQRAA